MKLYNLTKLKELFVPHYSAQLPAITSYKIFKLCKFIEQEEQFFEERRLTLIQEYAEKDENGETKVNEQGFAQIPEDKIQEAQMKLNELCELEIELPDIKFTLDSLSTLQFSVQDFAILEPIIKEG